MNKDMNARTASIDRNRADAMPNDELQGSDASTQDCGRRSRVGAGDAERARPDRLCRGVRACAGAHRAGRGLAPQGPGAASAQPAAACSVQGRSGPRGNGPPGPIGPRGDPGIRIVRHDCAGGNCTVECDDDEVLLTAHCGIGRAPAVYPTEHSALCRSRGTAKVEVVVACVKLSPR
jgi:hypothetical protein